MARKTAKPLCVDLDGTLIWSDLLVESALALVAKRPAMIFAMLAWLLRGKAHLKQKIAQHIELDVATLPYNQALIAWLRTQQGQRKILLCTASDEALAAQVASHVAVFDDVMASDGRRNLSGKHKAQGLVSVFGERGFDYAGNAVVDLAVWKHANAAIVVERGEALSKAAAKTSTVELRFQAPKASFRTWAKALRIHQWIKNILVFLPLIASHRAFDVPALLTTMLAFLCFGLCASSVYITNDLLDLAADRQHHRKRSRPYAAGTLPIISGPLLAIILLVASFGLSLLVHYHFAIVLLGYYTLTTAYSFQLKRIMMLDVVVLATLYTTRILAGTAAVHLKPSFWLLAFSMFFFLSLAMVKRFVELLSLQASGKVKASGRGYDIEDIPLIQSLGASSGYLAVLVLALYVDSTASTQLYAHPHYLWMLCPLLLYWISRTWAIAHRGLMHDDPVVFAVMDRTSQILGVIAAVIVALAI
ncbi:UbiA family prenyltransferase [Dyella sp.]|uniref:UbiA family prenyltransferase n=1 Tax=Dyella sp. TaxID=1869338 RepID=UPI002ED16C1F